MSAPAVRRLKDRGGAGGKIMAGKPSKSVTPPVSEKPLMDSAKKLAVEKENSSRSISRTRGGPVTQKPGIRPMPRVDKPAAADGESRNRLSMSSVPRGRSSSPSDFIRMLSDMRKNRVFTRDSGEKDSVYSSNRFGSNGRGSRVAEKKGIKEYTPGMREKGSNSLLVSSAKFRDEKDAKLNHIKNESRVSARYRNEATIDVHNVIPAQESSNVELNGGAINGDACKGKLDESLKSNTGSLSVKNEKMQSLKVPGGKTISSVKNSDTFKEKEVNGHGSSDSFAGKKSSSKLREKLAFLEGKVKRIASDINRTKDMLDMNNPDASKLIISDIQEKISGIEKAMGHVVGVSNGKLSRPADTNIVEAKIEQSEQDKQSVSEKVMKGLTSEELEARLFPHHKLLKKPLPSKALCSSSDGDGYTVSESIIKSTSADKLLGSTDKNPVVAELLSSIRKEQHKSPMVKDTYPEVKKVQDTEGAGVSATERQSSHVTIEKEHVDVDLTADESLDDFDDQENTPIHFVVEEIEDNSIYELRQVGHKTSTGGWFVSEGESVLLAHDDGSCSFYDITNNEEKAEYKAPYEISPNIWGDCWIVRAPSADGCSGKYVVAASAGNTSETGFCSWDFYTKEVRAFHIEEKATSTRQVLKPLPNNPMYSRTGTHSVMSAENYQWWYRPSGPLIASTATWQRSVKVYDIRDGEQIMKWDVQKPVQMMDYSSPLQWRNRGKAVIAEADAVSLWDVNSLSPQALLNVPSSGRQISALHVNNTDAEVGGGVRQRVSSSEAEGNDGVFSAADSINIMDFRQQSGIGLKIPKIGVSVESIFSRGDSVYVGCTSVKSAAKKQVCSQIQQFSIRKQKLVSTYVLPESNAHSHHTALTQVWGNSNLVMGICGLGLFVFDASTDELLPSFASDYSCPQKVREVIGPDDLYVPSFDFVSPQVLLISRDRPAMSRHLS